ncbi:hypothetical protein P7C70_g3648, partial [Phenoliferia sp. Uapishka_3]
MSQQRAVKVYIGLGFVLSLEDDEPFRGRIVLEEDMAAMDGLSSETTAKMVTLLQGPDSYIAMCLGMNLLFKQSPVDELFDRPGQLALFLERMRVSGSGWPVASAELDDVVAEFASWTLLALAVRPALASAWEQTYLPLSIPYLKPTNSSNTQPPILMSQRSSAGSQSVAPSHSLSALTYGSPTFLFWDRPTRQELALRAALIRQASGAQGRRRSAFLREVYGSEDFVPIGTEEKRFFKILNGQSDPQVVDEAISKAHALESMRELRKIAENILLLKEPDPSPEMPHKFRKLRFDNAKVKKVVEAPGAMDILLECRFRTRVIDFKEHLVFPGTPSLASIRSLRTGYHVISSTIEKTQLALDVEERMKEKARKENESQWDTVVSQIEADRDRMKARSQRKK